MESVNRLDQTRWTTVPFSVESKYLPSLKLIAKRKPREKRSVISSSDFGFEAKTESFVPQNQELKDKISDVVNTFIVREEHVVCQFWSPQDVGKRQLLTTVDQPFGLGAVEEELLMYRSLSECNPYVLHKDHGEEDSGPPVRVYRHRLPEWTPDITNYTPKDFPLQEHAIRCNLKGYAALPVFESATGFCEGVIELLTSSKYMDFAYEVKQIHSALKKVNLTTPQVFGQPTSNVPNEPRQMRLDKIHHILKVMCDKYDLPLAQTWAVSPHSSYVAHEKTLKDICSSFSTRCIGKVCMFTSDLPFCVRDLGKWDFREACKKRHLEKSCGLVGSTFLSQGSYFYGDVSTLREEEYPLVHNAGKSQLTGCFTIFLRDVDDDDEYVLEFFLPADIKDDRYVLKKMVQTLEDNIQANSGFELGVNDFSSDSNTDFSDSESVVENDTLELRAAFEMYDLRLPVSGSSGLLELENQVGQRVNLPGRKFVFKYLDDDNDLIRIACDDDLQYLINCQNNTTVNIIVELDDD